MKNLYKHLTLSNRLDIEKMLNSKTNKIIIAEKIGIHLSTLYREIKRGSVGGIYNANYSQNKYDSLLKEKGQECKLYLNKDLALLISNYILKDNLSISQIAKELKIKGFNYPTVNTIYKAIDNGLIPYVTRDNLVERQTNMYSKGIIHVPVWVKKEMNLHDGDKFEIKVENNKIIFIKL